MKFSTRTRYGLRFLVYLTLQQGGRFVQLNEVAEAEGVSLKYLEHIVRQLKPAGFIHSRRGAKGGYALAVDPAKTNLEEVFSCLEGDLAPIDCLEGERPDCPRHWRCSTVELWRELEEHIRSFLRGYSLEDLAERIREGQGTEMFYI